LSKSIHATGRSDLRGTVEGELRINNSCLWDKMIMAKRFFKPILAHLADHRIFGTLTAGSGSGRQGNKWQCAAVGFFRAHVFQVYFHWLTLANHRRYGLSGVKSASSAYRHYGVDIFGRIQKSNVVNHLRRWLAVYDVVSPGHP